VNRDGDHRLRHAAIQDSTASRVIMRVAETRPEMKNRLSDLNDHLFAQIERLAQEQLTAEQIETEVKRGTAIVAVADQILRHATLQVQAAKIVSDHGMDPTKHLPALGSNATRVIEGTKQ
jgi:hypothetical protein